MVRLRQEKEEYWRKHSELDFHSTMVRLRQTGRLPAGEELEKVISIPQWFDWDALPTEGLTISLFWFPFHNGSIETPVSLDIKMRPIQISIPQWFDWDKKKSILRSIRRFLFPFHYGSIETCQSFALTPAMTSLISIPQWFDWDQTHFDYFLRR